MPDDRSPPELSLVFSDRSGRPVVFPIPEGRCAVGSASDNDLVLDDPTVVPHQVVLERVGDRLDLLDLFAGDTRVNEERRHNGRVSPGDVLRLGEVRLRVMKVAPGRTGRLASATGRQATGRLGTSGAAARAAATGRLDAGRLDARQDAGRPSESGEQRRRASSQTERVAPRARSEEDTRPGGRALDADPATRPDAADPPTRPDPTVRGRSGRTTRALRSGQADEDGQRARERDARRARALARARQLADEIMPEGDFEVVFEKLANGFLDVFSADRAVTVLFEEDGINPLMVVERRRDGTAEGTGVAQEIVNRCLQVRSVIRVAGGYEGLGGLAAPLVGGEGRALGLLYFERISTPGHALGADDVHLMALLTNLASLKLGPLIA
ncbi:MAG: FHA domain-containing protein [Planctomycetota bacterium]